MGYPATRALADAFVRIYPDTAGFGEEAKAKVKAALTGIGAQTVRINVVADVSQSEILGLKRKMQAAGLSDFLGTNLSQGQIQNQILLLKRKLDQAKLADFLALNINTANLTDQINKLKRETLSIPVVYDVASLPNIGNLGDRTFTIKSIGVADVGKQIGDLSHEVDLLTQGFMLLDDELTKKIAAFAALNVAAAATAKAMAAATAAATANAAATAAAGAAAANTGRRLLGTIPLWGGVAGAAGLVTLGLHAAIEGFVAIVPAVAALGITLYGMLPAAQDVYNHLQSINTVNSALGSNIPPLTGKFAALQQALAPSVLELYGGGLTLINRNTGFLGSILTQVSHLLEGWIANIDIWAAHQNNLGKILQNGVAFLMQWGHVFGSLGLALANLIRADPGVAHFLLDIVEGAAKVLDIITRLPAPLLTLALGLHAVYLYGGLAATGLLKLAGVVGLDKLAKSMGILTQTTTTAANGAKKVETAFLGLSGRVWVGITAGAIAVGFLAYQLLRADASTRNFINAQNALLQQTPASQLFGAISDSIGKTVQQIQGVPAKVAAAGEAVRRNAQGFFGDLLDEAKARSFQQAWSAGVNAVSSVFRSLGLNIHATAEQLQQSADIEAYKKHIDGLLQSQKTLAQALVYTADGAGQAQQKFDAVSPSVAGVAHHFDALGTASQSVTKPLYTVQQSLALMQLAGVGVNDSFEVMKQKIDNLITGYKNMGVQGGILANSVNAVTFQTELQGSNVAALTGAWDTFFGLVSGGVSGMLTFEAALRTLDTQAKISTANLGLLSAGQVTTGQDFVSAASAAQQQLDALTKLAAAAGLGSQGTDILTQSTKDLVQSLLPAAKGSQDFTTILYALAQQGGYRGADSFKALSTWVGNTKQPMKDLQKQTETLTVAAGNLTTDVNNLANAIQGQLNAAMSQAIFNATGGQKSFDKFATAVLGAHGNIQDMIPSAETLGRQLLITTGSTQAAHREFDAFAIGLGLTKQQADKLWQDSLPALQRTIDGMHGKNVPVGVTLTGQGRIAINASGAYIQGESGHIVASGFAAGTSGAAPGWAWVGERGPELVKFTGGETVVPNHRVGGYAEGTIPAAIADVSAIVDPMIGRFGVGVARRFTDAFTHALATAWGGLGGPGPGVPGNLGAYSSIAAYVLKILNQPARDLPVVMTQMNTESGGNPYAVNRSDINWIEGHPSVGLMQVIAGTYAGYGAPRYGYPPPIAYGVSENPLANIYAGMAYAVARYGSDYAFGPPTGWTQVLGHGHGYDHGGRLPPGVSLAWNKTGRSEVVAPSGLDELIGAVQENTDAVNELASVHADLMGRLIGVTANGPSTFASVLSGAARTAGYRGLYTP